MCCQTDCMAAVARCASKTCESEALNKVYVARPPSHKAAISSICYDLYILRQHSLAFQASHMFLLRASFTVVAANMSQDHSTNSLRCLDACPALCYAYDYARTILLDLDTLTASSRRWIVTRILNGRLSLSWLTPVHTHAVGRTDTDLEFLVPLLRGLLSRGYQVSVECLPCS